MMPLGAFTPARLYLSSPQPRLGPDPTRQPATFPALLVALAMAGPGVAKQSALPLEPADPLGVSSPPSPHRRPKRKPGVRTLR